MSALLSQLCEQLVGEMFGPVCESVVGALLSHGPRPLRALLVKVPHSGRHVRLALQVLLRHSIVTTAHDSPLPASAAAAATVTSAIYTAWPETVVQLARCGRHAELVRQLLGDQADAMFCRLVEHGRLTTAALVAATGGATSSEARATLAQLVASRYVRRCSGQPKTASAATGSSSGGDLFAAPPPLPDAAADTALWWCVDVSRLENQLRDQLLLRALERTCSPQHAPAAQLVLRAVLSAAADCSPLYYAVSNPVSVTEVRKRLTASSSSGRQREPPVTDEPDSTAVSAAALFHLGQYLRLLCCGPVAVCDRYGDAGGGQYLVNMRRALETLVWSVADGVVGERFGSRAARVYRVVRAKKYVDQDRLQQWAMLAANEAKMLSYQLHKASLLAIYDLRRPGQQQQQGGRLSFLFTVSYSHTLLLLHRLCQRALLNAVLLRRARAQAVRRLRDKVHRVEQLAEQLLTSGADQQQVEEVREAVSEPEREQLRHEDAVADRLLGAESQLESTMFIVSMASKLHQPL